MSLSHSLCWNKSFVCECTCCLCRRGAGHSGWRCRPLGLFGPGGDREYRQTSAGRTGETRWDSNTCRHDWCSEGNTDLDVPSRFLTTWCPAGANKDTCELSYSVFTVISPTLTSRLWLRIDLTVKEKKSLSDSPVRRCILCFYSFVHKVFDRLH